MMMMDIDRREPSPDRARTFRVSKGDVLLPRGMADSTHPLGAMMPEGVHERAMGIMAEREFKLRADAVMQIMNIMNMNDGDRRADKVRARLQRKLAQRQLEKQQHVNSIN